MQKYVGLLLITKLGYFLHKLGYFNDILATLHVQGFLHISQRRFVSYFKQQRDKAKLFNDPPFHPIFQYRLLENDELRYMKVICERTPV